MLDKEYRLYVKHDKKTLIDKSAPLNLHDVIHKLFMKLQKLNALLCVDDGEFIETIDYFNKEVVVKRFVVTVRIPYTQFIIKKESTGSINQELFISTLRYIKENYYEGI
jgi:hypothetical protein